MNKLFGVAVAGLLAIPAVADAQGIGAEAAGIYATLSGDDFQGIDAGFGLDAQLRFNAAPRFSIGAGVQLTSHGNNVVSENTRVTGFFAEPRLTFSMPASPLTPFLGARVGLARTSLSSGGTDVTSSGWLFGGTGGAMFRAGPMVNVVLAVVFASVSFGDFEVNGTSQPGTETSGTSLALRGGVSIKLGR